MDILLTGGENTADFAAGDHFKVKLSACPASLQDNQQSVRLFLTIVFINKLYAGGVGGKTWDRDNHDDTFPTTDIAVKF